MQSLDQYSIYMIKTDIKDEMALITEITSDEKM